MNDLPTRRDSNTCPGTGEDARTGSRTGPNLSPGALERLQAFSDRLKADRPVPVQPVRLDQATPEALRAAVIQLVYGAIGRFANGESMQDQVDTALKCLRAQGEDMAELETQHVVDDVEPDDTAAGLDKHERVSVWGPTDGDKTSIYLCPSGQNPIVVRGEDADYMGYLYVGVAAARLLAARLLSAAARADARLAAESADQGEQP